MKPVEKLARRICWLEFALPVDGTTEVAYWRGVSPAKKAEYVEDARWLIWMVDRLAARDPTFKITGAARAQIAEEKARLAQARYDKTHSRRAWFDLERARREALSAPRVIGR